VTTSQVKAPAVKTPTDTPTGNVDIEVKTPEQLGFDCFGYRQFLPGGFDKNLWQENLWTAYSGLVDASHKWNGTHTAAALTAMTGAQTAFTETFGRCRAAVLANDKIESWKAAHTGDWHAPPVCTTTFGACDPARIN
jgi:hypothetical protein